MRALPHYRQSNPGACLPACARMVLAAMGHSYTESELAKLMGSYSFGTPASRIKRLEQLGVQVSYGSGTLDDLQSALEDGNFPVVLVAADFLPWADFSGFHAMVLAELSETAVSVMDPALPTGPSELSIDAFLMTWDEFDNRMAIIYE